MGAATAAAGFAGLQRVSMIAARLDLCGFCPLLDILCWGPVAEALAETLPVEFFDVVHESRSKTFSEALGGVQLGICDVES